MEVPILPFDRNMPVFPGASFAGGSRKRASNDGGSEERSKSPRLESHGDGGNGGNGGGIESQFETWDTDEAECQVIEERPEMAIAITSAFSTADQTSNQTPPNN